RECISVLAGTEYGTVLDRQYKEYEKTLEISVLLFALDDYYYSKIPQIAGSEFGDERIILKMLKAQADIKNISNACRAVSGGMNVEKVEELMIKSGNIPMEVLGKACHAKNVEEAVKIFDKYYPLSKALEEYKKTGSLIPIEMELERNVAKKGLKVLRNSVLSLGSIAGFLLLKEEEVSNIRKIVRCKEFNLPNEKIKEMMVVV
ncbi:MAG TPA: V-type ATPase subunit, partial [archaeon]|nr:V-type ATPase subunit [archaeon]